VITFWAIFINFGRKIIIVAPQEWFSRSILALSKEFRNSNASVIGDLPKLNDNSVQVIQHQGYHNAAQSIFCEN
jgi:hypothetical protein